LSPHWVEPLATWPAGKESMEFAQQYAEMAATARFEDLSSAGV